AAPPALRGLMQRRQQRLQLRTQGAAGAPAGGGAEAAGGAAEAGTSGQSREGVSGQTNGEELFVMPRGLPSLPPWQQQRMRTSTSVLAGMYELLRHPEYRLPQLDPRVIEQDLPLVRHASQVLATHGSLVRQRLQDHWRRAALELEQLTFDAVRASEPDPSLLYQHQRDRQQRPAGSSSYGYSYGGGSGNSPNAAAVHSPSSSYLHPALLTAASIMTTKTTTTNRVAHAHRQHADPQSSLGDTTATAASAAASAAPACCSPSSLTASRT
ncbi:hypothetical protein Agub_g8014, partial [Astrephomene gubernaculifera]